MGRHRLHRPTVLQQVSVFAFQAYTFTSSTETLSRLRKVDDVRVQDQQWNISCVVSRSLYLT
jgi:hypothetical protein